MGESHISHSQPVKVTEDAEAVADQVATFETGEGRHFAGFVNALHVAACVGEFNIVGSAQRLLMKRVDHLQGARKELDRSEILRLSIDAEQDRSDMAFTQPRQIELVVRMA